LCRSSCLSSILYCIFRFFPFFGLFLRSFSAFVTWFLPFFLFFWVLFVPSLRFFLQFFFFVSFVVSVRFLQFFFSYLYSLLAPCAFVSENNVAATKALLQSGADPKRRLLGIAAASLEAAALCGHIEVCTVLLDAGAEINGSSKIDGCTPLIKAATGGNCAVIKLLLDRGADSSQENHKGETPLVVSEANESAHESGDATTLLRAATGTGNADVGNLQDVGKP
jgi:hypothetical protein